jgi:2-hydroxy-3-keto-5-methylthiopentenyl-1-phosphate phosphatase
MMTKLAVITDFDGTLMEQDVGNEIMHALGIKREARVIEAGQRVANKEIGSLGWIQQAYPLLEGRREEVDRLLETVHLRAGALDFLSFCKQQQIPVSIVSDGMEYYIERLLQINGVKVEQIISNPISYQDDGGFSFGVQNSNKACQWCGCCKAEVVRKQKEADWNVIYIGDGSSDFYGSSFSDWVFARSSLARHLEQEGIGYYPFQSFHDVLAVIEPKLDQFRQGTAELRVEKGNPFCKFA